MKKRRKVFKKSLKFFKMEGASNTSCTLTPPEGFYYGKGGLSAIVN
jgi:hypothetical protein